MYWPQPFFFHCRTLEVKGALLRLCGFPKPALRKVHCVQNRTTYTILHTKLLLRVIVLSQLVVSIAKNYPVFWISLTNETWTVTNRTCTKIQSAGILLKLLTKKHIA